MSVVRHLRWVGVAIAVAAVFDPSVTTQRLTKPHVALAVLDSARDADLAARVARELSGRFTVSPVPFGAAAAVVVVGDAPPGNGYALPSRAAAVVPAPSIVIESVEGPSRVSIDARAVYTAAIRVDGAPGRRITLSLEADGVTSDREERVSASPGERLVVSLELTPAVPGAVHIRISAAAAGDSRPQSRDMLLEVDDRRWNVLFFDPRPSWISTFVRREIENDRRFAVSNRTFTSRGVTSATGDPPRMLDRLDGLDAYDVVVIGVPEQLDERSVVTLEQYLRTRGGSVLLLPDRLVLGPYARLLGAVQWDSASSRTLLAIRGSLTGEHALLASELAWPRRLPPGASRVAGSPVGSGGSPSTAPRDAIWSVPVGAGQLAVSGAYDSWRFRDDTSANFAGFWRTLLATMAEGSPRPVSIALTSSVVAPGERVDVDVILRDAALRPLVRDETATVRVMSALRGAGPDRPLRLWPGEEAGHLMGTVRAPVDAGLYELHVSTERGSARVPVLVEMDVAARGLPEPDLLSGWVASRGGFTLPADRLRELSGLLSHSVPAVSERVTWHPMRSGWWIVPFALALGGEWLWRRRRGLP